MIIEQHTAAAADRASRGAAATTAAAAAVCCYVIIYISTVFCRCIRKHIESHRNTYNNNL